MVLAGSGFTALLIEAAKFLGIFIVTTLLLFLFTMWMRGPTRTAKGPADRRAPVNDNDPPPPVAQDLRPPGG